MSSQLNLDALIASLTDGEGQEKQASEMAAAPTPSVSEDLKAVLMTKSASERRGECEDLGRALARRLLEKAAAEDEKDKDEKEKDDEGKDKEESKDKKEEGQDKQASFEEALAGQLKQATEGSAPQANLSQDANAQMAQEQIALDAAAKQSGGTVEQQQVESLQKGLATQSAQAGAYDKVEAELDKAAALIELMDQGDSFYEAFEKVAEADMELQKQAAYETLVEAGMGFEEAVNLVKEAAEKKPYGVASGIATGAVAGAGSILGGGSAVLATDALQSGAQSLSKKTTGLAGGKISEMLSRAGSAKVRGVGAAGLLLGGGAVLGKALNNAHSKGKASQ